MEINELYLPKYLFVDSNSPSMIITYDTDKEQYVIKLKKKEQVGLGTSVEGIPF